MLIALIINAITFSLGLALVFSKKYSRLRLVQLYAFGSVVVTVAYILFYYNWYGYLFINIVGPVLFALAYWEVCKKLENRSANWVWPVLLAILTVPLWPVEFVIKTYVPFAIVNLFIAFDIGRAWKNKNPFVLTWTILGSFALTLDILKLILPTQNLVLVVLQKFEMLSRGMGDSILLLIVLWHPIMAWLPPKLKKLFPSTDLEPAYASIGNNDSGSIDTSADVIDFPGNSQTSELEDIQNVSDDLNLLEPLLMSATRMISLSNKPFLNCEDLRDYLDLDDEQIDTFIKKYQIKKFHLLENAEEWVVRRQDVENIPSDGTTNFRSHDNF